ncbi:MAG: hypothetical protein MHPSP_001084, partial [Paramarteilia canceri]
RNLTFRNDKKKLNYQKPLYFSDGPFLQLENDLVKFIEQSKIEYNYNYLLVGSQYFPIEFTINQTHDAKYVFDDLTSI